MSRSMHAERAHGDGRRSGHSTEAAMQDQQYLDDAPAGQAMRRSRESPLEDDAFLQRVSRLLDALRQDCKDKGRNDGAARDLGMPLETAENLLRNVRWICKDAGLPVDEDEEGAVAAAPDSPVSTAGSLASSRCNSSALDNALLTASSRHYSEPALSVEQASMPAKQQSRPRQTHQLPVSAGDDMIEVEITDILTSTQEEIQRWQHAFRMEMMEHQARQHDLNRQHVEQIHALQDALDSSNQHISRLEKGLHDAECRIQALQGVTTKAQKAMEATLAQHSRYWKSICNDLVIEKRNLAKRLAEERGKSSALKEHIEMHQSKSIEARNPTNSHQEECPVLPLSKEALSGKVTTPRKWPLDMASEAVSAMDKLRLRGSREKTSTQRKNDDTDQASFRRYYLAKKQ